MSPPSDKCLKCTKLCLEGQNCIQCDKCDGWIHLKCSGIRLKDFKNMTKNTEFVCIFCTNYPCGKCSKPVYNTQNAINCSIDVCSKWFHLRCTPFSLADYLNRKSRLHTEHWFCPDCMGMPFNDLTDIEFCEFIHDELKLREYFNILAGNTDFSNKCSVCNKRVNDDQKPKCIPCISCNCLVHKKCSNIKLTDLLSAKPSDLRYWSCNTCQSGCLPFQNENDSEILNLNFNSLLKCPCSNNSVDAIDYENLASFSIYDHTAASDSPLTHGPDPSNYLDTAFDINAKCNYYTNHEFHKFSSKIQPGQAKPFSVFHSNIQSLSHNFDQLEMLLTDLGYNFDVIALSETWNAENSKDKFIPKRIDGYEKYNGITGNSIKSGCGFYIRNGLKFVDRKKLDFKHFDDLNEYQTKFIEIINEKGANIILGVTYRHPKKASNNMYTDKLQETLDIILQEHKIVILTGDFNYKLLKYKEDKNVTYFTDMMLSNYLQPIINKPTRVINKQKPSLIDNFFVNAIDKDITCGNFTSKITDHMPNFMFMKNIKFDHKRTKKMIRCTKNVDVMKYQQDLASIDLTPVLLTTNDVNIVYKYYHDQACNIVNKHFPFRTLTDEEIKWIDKPWINRYMQGLIKEKTSCTTNISLKTKTHSGMIGTPRSRTSY